MKVGLLHPGEMGAALGAALVGVGHEVGWASEGRSRASRQRAALAGLTDRGSVAGLVGDADLVVAVCPPAAAERLADLVASCGYRGVYLEANAVSPATTLRCAALVAAAGGRFVDGGIVGPPPQSTGTTRLYLSGPGALEISEAWSTPLVETVVMSESVGDASALKLAYAAWTKGSAALLLTVRAVAAATGVEAWLLDEWATSQPGLEVRSASAAASALSKGWRWGPEMGQVADLVEAVGLPGGFHRAAAETFARLPRTAAPPAAEDPVALALGALVSPQRPGSA